MSRIRPLLMLVFVALAQVGSPHALAQSEQDKATTRVLLGEGDKYFDAGDYAKALVAYEAAIKLTQHHNIALNIARCHLELAKLDPARRKDTLAAYKLYLELFARNKPGEVPPARDEVERNISLLEKVLAAEKPAPPQPEPLAAAPAPRKTTLSVEGVPDGGTLLVDGVLRGQGPILAPLEVEPGQRRVQVRAEGFAPWTGEVMARAGEESTLKLELKRPQGRSTLWLAMGIATTTLAAGFLGLGVAGNLQYNTLYEEAGNKNTDETDTWKATSIAGYALAGTMAAAAIASWVLYGLSSDSGKSEAQAGAAPVFAGAAPCPGGAAVTAGVRF